MLDYLEPPQLAWQGTAPRSLIFDDVYAQPGDSRAETDYVFLRGNDLPERWRGRSRFVVGETGFGTGLNFLATWQRFRDTAAPDAVLHYLAVERYPLAGSDLARAHRAWPDLEPLALELQAAYPPLEPGFHPLRLDGGRVRLLLIFDDASDGLGQLQAAVDAWYLDGFAPGKNPAMWNEGLLKRVGALTVDGGSVATFTAAGQVRRDLEAAGFAVERRSGFGAKREMLVGRRVGGLPRSPGRIGGKRATVVGGGLAGVGAARALAERGFAVTLVENQGALAGGASGNAAGLVMPLTAAERSPNQRWYGAGYGHTLARLAELQVPWRACGVLQGAWNAREVDRQEGLLTRLRPPATSVRGVSAAEATDLSGLAVSWSGVFYPGGGVVAPAVLCQHWLEGLGEVEQVHHRQVSTLTPTPLGWRVADADGVIATAEVLVLAVGATAPVLAPLADLPLRPVRGQLSALAATPQSRALATAVCTAGYVLPAAEDLHWLGATYDHHSDSPLPDAVGHRHNLAQLQQGFPALAAALGPDPLGRIVGGRAAVRATTPARLPGGGPVLASAAFGTL